MNANELSQCLYASMSADLLVRRPAENYLKECEKVVGYTSALFEVIFQGESNIKLSAAISFKNFTKRNWICNDSNDDKINADDREFVKRNIIDLMLNTPPQVQRQLSEAVGIIGKTDFPDNWPTLLPQLVAKITDGDFVVINVILRTCHSLFKRYRFESRSDTMWLSIKAVIEKMAAPLTQLMQQTMVLTKQHSSNKEHSDILWSSILLISKIFLSLNHQDLPEYFEDNMAVWMTQFHEVLLMPGSHGDSEEAGLEEQAKTEVCEILSLYAARYDEEFSGEFLKVFLADVYKLMLATTSKSKYDSLVTAAIHFLGIVANKPRHRDVFNVVINVQDLCQKVILPNIELQKADMEMFEDSAEEYMRKDIEGSDALTRRKSACELVKSLTRFQESEMVAYFGQYIESLLSAYAADPRTHWKAKDSALFLVTSVASRGETERLGVTATTAFVNTQSFYDAHIAPELKGAVNNNSHPIVLAACLKYLVAFRTVLSPSSVLTAINTIPVLLSHPSTVVYSYCAVAINKLLMIRADNQGALISAQSIAAPIELVSALAASIGRADNADNHYLMQALMRTLSALQHLAVDSMNALVPLLAQRLALVVANPRRPLYNHYLVESIALSITIVCRSASQDVIAAFESLLLPTLSTVLVNSVEEFIPYAFQLCSLLLDLYPRGAGTPVPDNYTALFPFLVHPALWESSGNVPALIRLLLSYLERTSFVEHLPALVALFQRLNTSRALDSFGFSLITALLANMAVDPQHLRAVFVAIFQRLSRNKTTKYVRGFVQFLATLCCIAPSVGDVVQLVDSIQPNLFRMTLESCVLPTVGSATAGGDRKVCAVGVTRLAEALAAMDAYRGYWPTLVARVVEVLANYTGEDKMLADAVALAEAHFIDVDDVTTRGSTALNQLLFVPKKTVDPAASAADPRLFLGDSVKRLSASQPQVVGALEPAVVEALRQLLATVGVSL